MESLPPDAAEETFEEIIRSPSVRVERIISQGQSSPGSGWYDQDENEWVMLIKGNATLEWEDGSITDLSAGDYLNIPAHRKHRVLSTAQDEITVWLAVFYKDP
jgi:cupin 2 domain-containing protein